MIYFQKYLSNLLNYPENSEYLVRMIQSLDELGLSLISKNIQQQILNLFFLNFPNIKILIGLQEKMKSYSIKNVETHILLNFKNKIKDTQENSKKINDDNFTKHVVISNIEFFTNKLSEERINASKIMNLDIE